MAQLVDEQSAELFAFRHALTHEAVYGTVLVRERVPAIPEWKERAVGWMAWEERKHRRLLGLSAGSRASSFATSDSSR